MTVGVLAGAVVNCSNPRPSTYCFLNGGRTVSSPPFSTLLPFHSHIHRLHFHPTFLSTSPPSLFPSIHRRAIYHRRGRTTKLCVFLSHFTASMEQPEETYIMVKPDGVQRGFIGDIISRFEKKGFKLKGLKLVHCSKELAEEHYKDLTMKPFFPKLVDHLSSGPVVSMVWEGVGVVAWARKLIGSTNPLEAAPGTIRGDLAILTGRNVVHSSDSLQNGKREIALWFKEGELCQSADAD